MSPAIKRNGTVPLKSFLRIASVLLVLYLVVAALAFFLQRGLIYFPTHAARPSMLKPWFDGDQTIGYCREVEGAETVWLMMHGNAGQAAERQYVLERLSDRDALHVLEYPGYGARAGSPSLESINQAATAAYQLLRTRYPSTPVCVLGESIGSGPASALATQQPPPNKIVLVVPFDSMVNVARQHFPFLPIRLMLKDAWDNVTALEKYGGPIEVFGAINDSIIPVEHAKALAEQVPGIHLTLIPGDHNDWSSQQEVRIVAPP